jgi:hypothetical protein
MYCHRLIVMLLIACSLLLAGCSRSKEAELARIQAEAEAAKAKAEAERAKLELEKLKAERAPKQSPQSAPAQAAPTPAQPATATVQQSEPERTGDDAWYFDWKILANDKSTPPPKPGQYAHGWHAGELDTTYGIRPPYEGAGKRPGIMILHPLSGNEPAKLGRTVAVSADKPVLVVEAAGSNAGDCVLRCVVNGKDVGEYVLDGKKWTSAEFDLSEFVGKMPAEIEVWNVAGGSNNWYFETCFIDKILFRAK